MALSRLPLITSNNLQSALNYFSGTKRHILCLPTWSPQALRGWRWSTGLPSWEVARRGLARRRSWRNAPTWRWLCSSERWTTPSPAAGQSRSAWSGSSTCLKASWTGRCVVLMLLVCCNRRKDLDLCNRVYYPTALRKGTNSRFPWWPSLLFFVRCLPFPEYYFLKKKRSFFRVRVYFRPCLCCCYRLLPVEILSLIPSQKWNKKCSWISLSFFHFKPPRASICTFFCHPKLSVNGGTHFSLCRGTKQTVKRMQYSSIVYTLKQLFLGVRGRVHFRKEINLMPVVDVPGWSISLFF